MLARSYSHTENSALSSFKSVELHSVQNAMTAQILGVHNPGAAGAREVEQITGGSDSQISSPALVVKPPPLILWICVQTRRECEEIFVIEWNWFNVLSI